MAKRMTRTELRELLYRLLFCLEFHSGEEYPEQQELYLEAVPGASDREKQELRDKFFLITEHLEEIDAKIEAKAEGWTVNRLAKADLTVLRLAVYELLYDENVPTGVAINEAVELAKAYGGEKSTGFVNGILASVAKELPGGERPDRQQRKE